MKMFNINKYKHWHGPDAKLRKGTGGRANMAQRAKERQEAREAQRANAEKAKKAKKKPIKKVKVQIRNQEDRPPKSHQGSSKQKYKFVPRKIKPFITPSGLYAVKMGLFGQIIYFKSVVSKRAAYQLIEKKIRQRDELFKKIEITRGEAYQLKTFLLFEDYLKNEKEGAKETILSLYGKK
jgi:hypothetical protein